jgi:hypothetical protein
MDSNITPDGWIYCLSNPCMPGILKVGMTERTPEERIKELYTTGVALPFKVEFAKKVKDPKRKEATLHTLLEQYTDRINPRREFFRVSPEEVMKFFDLMDGEMLTDKQEEEDNKDDEENEEETSSELSPHVKSSNVKSERDMKKCFTNGQRIRHRIGINKTWIGVYDSSKNGIVYNGNFYTSLSNFALLHNRVYNPTRMSINGWTYCECEVDGNWISTYSLPSKVTV